MLTVADVPMLIDSGADITLVPKKIIEGLGINSADGRQYELLGFDGSKSTAQSAQLDLLLLRRAFSGRFLLIDQEWGIIGRDILNHLSIVLDGPQLAWSEFVPGPSIGSKN